MQRWTELASLVNILLLSALLACNQGHPLPSEESPGVDRISKTPPAAPKSLIHGTFALKKYEKFPFEVPSHVINPRVMGVFSSYVQGPGGMKVSDESADVELMVMTEAQCDDFIHGRSAESVDAIEPSHNHGVRITLPNSHDEPVRYFVVFRRSAEGKTPISVYGDLTAEFGPSM